MKKDISIEQGKTVFWLGGSGIQENVIEEVVLEDVLPDEIVVRVNLKAVDSVFTSEDEKLASPSWLFDTPIEAAMCWLEENNIVVEAGCLSVGGES